MKTPLPITRFPSSGEDTRQNSFKELGEHEGQCVCLRLSEDERCLVMGGNHRDYMVFDAESGEELDYGRTADADFYVTNGWLDGDRLIFTTDLGLLYECVPHLQRGKGPGPAGQNE